MKHAHPAHNARLHLTRGPTSKNTVRSFAAPLIKLALATIIHKVIIFYGIISEIFKLQSSL